MHPLRIRFDNVSPYIPFSLDVNEVVLLRLWRNEQPLADSTIPRDRDGNANTPFPTRGITNEGLKLWKTRGAILSIRKSCERS
jgi:hypothetical protein